MDNTSVPFDKGKKHSFISMLLLGGLFFLRFPFLIFTQWRFTGEPVALGLAFFTFSICTYALTAILIWWEREHLRDFWIDLAAAITFLLQMFCFPMGLGLFAAMRRQHARFPSPPAGVWRWALVGAMLAIVTNIFTRRLGLEPPGTRSSEPATIGFLITGLVVQMTTAAVFEEPLFRGFLWGYLRRVRWQDGWIWLFQALLFTFGHVYFLQTEPIGPWFIRIVFASLVIGLIAWRARSIFASMVTHGMFNASNNMLLHTRSLTEAVNLGWAVVVGTGVMAAGLWMIERMRHRQLPAAR